MSLSLSDQERMRREALKQLRDLGIDPYPAAEFDTTAKAAEVKEKYEEGKEVFLAGRLMNRRIMGIFVAMMWAKKCTTRFSKNCSTTVILSE